MTALPDPLTPADCDLRGLPYMPLDVIRLLDSDMFAEATGDEFKAAVALWCKSWTQIPAGSLPNKDKVLAELSRAKNWKRVKETAMRGWILCSDDRWYHPVVAEKALNALPAREEFNSKKSADAERKARERDDRKALFELLKSHGVVPDWNVSTKVLRGMAAQYLSQDLLQHVTGNERDMSQHVTVSKGEERERESVRFTAEASSSSTVPDRDEDRGVPPLPTRETPPLSDDPAIQLAVHLRRQGVNAQFTHPAVQEWVKAGIDFPFLDAAVRTARERLGETTKIQPNYLVPIVNDIVNPPAAAPGRPQGAPAAPPRKPQGMDPKGLDESYDDYQARIDAAEANRRKGPTP